MSDPNETQPEEKPLVDRLQSLLQKGMDFIGRGDDRVELRDIILALQAEPVLVVNKGLLIHGIDPDADLTSLTDALEEQFGALDDAAVEELARKAAEDASEGSPAATEEDGASEVELPEPAMPLPSPDRLPDPEPELPEPTPAFPSTPTLPSGLTSDPPPGPEPTQTSDPLPGERTRVTVGEPEERS
jgi:hypothetical protein